jgi:glycosyltransferase involved in cell wall biosynthesis
MTHVPKFSIVTPVYNPRPDDLRAMLESVRAQRFEDFEHCIVDDNSTAAHVVPALRAAAATDARVRFRTRAEQGGIVAATNDALEMADGEFVAFLDHDDTLHVDALRAVAEAVAGSEDVDYVYTDEDKIDLDGKHFGPFLKPDWSPDRLRAQMYTCHLSVARRALVDELGGLRPGFDGAQDWDLVLRVTERARRVVHIPRILYHWRATEGSAAADPNAKPWARDPARRAVTEHIERVGLQAEVQELPGVPGNFRLRPALRDRPLVSIVIPTGGFLREIYGTEVNLVLHTVRSIIERSTYDNIELVVVVDDGTPAATRTQLLELGAQLVPFSRRFSFSEKINVGVLHARGDHLLLLNDDVEVLPEGWRDSWPGAEGHSSWIEAMLMYALDPGIGSVGGKMYFGDTRLQHVGLACTGGGPSHIYRAFPHHYGGYFNNARIPVNYLALTGACLMTRRDVFDAVGGFCRGLPINFNDVDYCLKLHHAGYRNVFTPEAELLHFESSSREAKVHLSELQFLKDRWDALLFHDPFYNPQFAPGKPDFVVPTYLNHGEFAGRG